MGYILGFIEQQQISLKKEKEKAPPSCTAAEAAASFVAEPCPTGGLPGITRAQAVPSQVCA